MKHWFTFSSDERISLNPKHIDFLRGEMERPRITTNWIHAIILLFAAMAMPQQLWAGNASDAKAQQLFTKVYNLVFGPQGSAMNYKVNIIGLYKTEGKIVYKGRKVHYTEKRFMAWEISNFRSGNIADSNFIFPKQRFKDYKFIDKRKE